MALGSTKYIIYALNLKPMGPNVSMWILKQCKFTNRALKYQRASGVATPGYPPS